MRFKLFIAKRTHESALCEQFLTWVGCTYDFECKMEVLKIARGTTKPVLYFDGKEVGFGFPAIFNFFNKEGMLPC